MVESEEPSQVWHIGPGAFRVGSAFLRRTKVVERARAAMDQLMRDTGETANLGVEVGDEVLFLSQVETHQAIRAFFPPGTMAPMHVSGIGKALLAWYPEEKVTGILARKGLERFTTLTHTSESALLRDLARTRDRGFAIDDQERAEGMRCVAAPVFPAHGEPIAARQKHRRGRARVSPRRGQRRSDHPYCRSRNAACMRSTASTTIALGAAMLNRRKLSPPVPKLAPWLVAIRASFSTRAMNSFASIPVPEKSSQAR